MSPLTRFAALVLTGLVLVAGLPTLVDAQRRAVPRHPPHPERAVVVRGHVFIGGYFYDPLFGPYPWWPRTAYPYRYFPLYDMRGEVHLRVKPDAAEDAAVYVDGFYAGTVDDFNGVFQSLPLTPGGHTLVLYLEGFRTTQHHFYLSPGSSFTVRATMEALPAGETSEPPALAPPIPTPPPGTYRPPVTPPGKRSPESAVRAADAAGFGTLDIFVQPTSAEVTIDGQQWLSSDPGHFMVQVPAGMHHVTVGKPGYRRFSTDVAVAEGQTFPLNVSLMTTP